MLHCNKIGLLTKASSVSSMKCYTRHNIAHSGISLSPWNCNKSCKSQVEGKFFWSCGSWDLHLQGLESMQFHLLKEFHFQRNLYLARLRFHHQLLLPFLQERALSIWNSILFPHEFARSQPFAYFSSHRGLLVVQYPYFK